MEFNSFEGVCKHCGYKEFIMAGDQKDADIKIYENCSCGGHFKGKRLDRAKELIDNYFDWSCEVNDGLVPVDSDVLPLLHKAAELINAQIVDAVSVTITPAIKCSMSMTSKGVIKVRRVDTETFEGGA
jgi:hypothetical protein